MDLQELITSADAMQLNTLPLEQRAAWLKGRLGELEDQLIVTTDDGLIRVMQTALYYFSGVLHAIGEDYAGAIRNLTEAHELAPKNDKITIATALAQAYLKSGVSKVSGQDKDYARAIHDLAEAYELAPNDNEITTALAQAYCEFAALKVIREDYAGAIRNLTEAHRLAPDDNGITIDLANAKISAKDYAGGIDDLANAHKLTPNDDSIRKNLARTYYEFGKLKSLGGNYAGAIRNLAEAHALDPNDDSIRENLAHAYYASGVCKLPVGLRHQPSSLQQKAYAEAINDFENAHKLTPNNTCITRHLVDQYYESGVLKVSGQDKDYAGAINDFLKARELDPNQNSIRKELAAAYYASGVSKVNSGEDYVGMVDDLAKAHEITPNEYTTSLILAEFAEAYRNDVKVRYASGELNSSQAKCYVGVIKNLTEAHTLVPHNSFITTALVQACNEFGGLKYLGGDYAGAISYFLKVRELDPHHGYITSNLADAYARSGLSKVRGEDYAGAISDLENARALNPNDYGVIVSLAGAYHKSGVSKLEGACYKSGAEYRVAYAAAISDLENAHTLTPDNDGIALSLAGAMWGMDAI